MPKWLKWIKSAIFTATVATMLTVTTANASEKVIELTGRNSVYFNQTIDKSSVHSFMQSMVGARTTLPLNQTLYVILYSGGGDYYGAVTMGQIIKKIPNTVVICSYCASGAGLVFITAGTHSPRYVHAGSVMIMHEMYLRHVTSQQLTAFLAQSMKKDSDEFNKAHYSIIGISKEEYEKKIIGKEWRLEENDIVTNHAADKLVVIHCDDYMKQVAPATCNPPINATEEE